MKSDFNCLIDIWYTSLLMKVEKFLPPPDKDSVFLEDIKPKSRENIRSFIKEESKNLPPKDSFWMLVVGIETITLRL